jgi:hypothetical protein
MNKDATRVHLATAERTFSALMTSDSPRSLSGYRQLGDDLQPDLRPRPGLRRGGSVLYENE